MLGCCQLRFQLTGLQPFDHDGVYSWINTAPKLPEDYRLSKGGFALID